MGITNRLLPIENTSLGRPVGAFDTAADPEDQDNDLDAFTAFMRATKAPPRDRAADSSDAMAGAALFGQIGCTICHVASFTTVAPGTAINGGAFVVPRPLGNKNIHPHRDILLPHIRTGDGIVP